MHLLTLKRCAIHKFQNKNKSKLADGSADIFSVKDDEQHNSNSIKIAVKQHAQLLAQGSTLILITYEDSFSYLWARSDCLLSFSFEKKTEGMEQFRHILDKSSTVYDIESKHIDNQILETIQTHFPKAYFQKQIISEKSFMKKVGSSLGQFTGNVNKVLGPKAASVGDAVGEKSTNIEKSAISDQKKEPLRDIKQKAQKVNSILSAIMKPAINAYNNMVESVGQSFDNSDNKIIKSVRQAGMQFSESVNKAQKKAQSTTATSRLSKKEQTQIQLK